MICYNQVLGDTYFHNLSIENRRGKNAGFFKLKALNASIFAGHCDLISQASDSPFYDVTNEFDRFGDNIDRKATMKRKIL